MYRKYIAGFVTVIGFLLAAGALLRAVWQQSGIAENPRQKPLKAVSLSWEKPVLETRDQRFLRGESISVPELAGARDYDGTDLTREIHYYDDKNRKIASPWRAKASGIYRVKAVVKSPVTKRKNIKTFLVLIDGGGSR